MKAIAHKTVSEFAEIKELVNWLAVELSSTGYVWDNKHKRLYNKAIKTLSRFEN